MATPFCQRTRVRITIATAHRGSQMYVSKMDCYSAASRMNNYYMWLFDFSLTSDLNPLSVCSHTWTSSVTTLSCIFPSTQHTVLV